MAGWIRLAAVGIFASLSWSGGQRVEAAAPRIVMISGLSLPAPVVSADWVVNDRIIGGDARIEVDLAEVADRPAFDVGLFWGQEWDDHVRSGQPLTALELDQANQRARFPPALGDAEVLFVYGSIPGPGWPVRAMTTDGLAALAALGVPVRLDESFASQAATPAPTAADCPVSQPVAADPAEPTQPAGMRRDPLGHGDWFVSEDGLLWAPADPGWQVGGIKVLWIKPIGATLTVRGYRLDDGATTLHADIPEGYFGDYHATGITIPTGGCWAIEARAGDSELRFVIWVEPAPVPAPPASCANLAELVAASDTVFVGSVIQREEAGDWVWQSIEVGQLVHGPFIGDRIALLQDRRAEPILEVGRSYLLFVAGDPRRTICPAQSLAEVDADQAPPRVARLDESAREPALWSGGDLPTVLAEIADSGRAGATPAA